MSEYQRSRSDAMTRSRPFKVTVFSWSGSWSGSSRRK